jgi:hypothetical protein
LRAAEFCKFLEQLDIIMSNTPLDLKPDSTTGPPIKMTLQIIKNAVILNADAILLELDMELHLKVHEEMKAINQDKSQTVDELFFKISRLPNAFGVTFTINGVKNQMPSAVANCSGTPPGFCFLQPEFLFGQKAKSLHRWRPSIPPQNGCLNPRV